MTTKVYCFSGLFHRFYHVAPEAFLSEVSLLVENPEVRGFYPDYENWGLQTGAHRGDIEEITAHIKQDSKDSDRVLMIGFSVGGYLAALIGNLVSASHVLAYAPPTDLRSVNIGQRGRQEFLDEQYSDLLPYCTGVPKMFVIADQNQRGRKNAHNPRQVNRLAGVPNLTIARRRKFDFKNDYFPNGHFATDLAVLLSNQG